MSEFPSVDASGFSADGRWFHQEGLWYYWDDSSQQYLLYQEQPPSPSPAASATSAAASSSAAAAKPAPKRKNTRIDPRNVPRPLTELQKASDKDAAGAQPIPVFHSRSGAVPPSPAIEFSVVDEGNCSPKYMRATLCQIPDRKEVLEESRLPLGLILQPFAGVNYDEPVQEVCCAKEDEGPIRCSRCGAYMNPFNFFEDEGRSFKCALCQRSNDGKDTIPLLHPFSIVRSMSFIFSPYSAASLSL